VIRVLASTLVALTFHASAQPLPAPVRAQIVKTDRWHAGCPVPLSGLRLITVSYWGFDGGTHDGQLVVNAAAARPLEAVFRRLYELHFPIRHMGFANMYGPAGRARRTAT